jgi:hypothetical protein
MLPPGEPTQRQIPGNGRIPLVRGTLHAGKVKAYIQLFPAVAAKALNGRTASSRKRSFDPQSARCDFRVSRTPGSVRGGVRQTTFLPPSGNTYQWASGWRAQAPDRVSCGYRRTARSDRRLALAPAAGLVLTAAGGRVHDALFLTGRARAGGRRGGWVGERPGVAAGIVAVGAVAFPGWLGFVHPPVWVRSRSSRATSGRRLTNRPEKTWPFPRRRGSG